MCKGWDTLMRQMERKLTTQIIRKGVAKGKTIGKKVGERIGERRGEKRGERIGERRGAVNAYDSVVRRALLENTPIDMIQRLTGVSRRRINMIAAGQIAD